MKKLFLLCCLFMACSCTFAQKKYLMLTLYYSNRWTLCGDIPNGMKETYETSTSVRAFKDAVKILDELAERGYEVEFMPDRKTYLLSKAGSSSPSAIRMAELNEYEDVNEIARYNLQGIPVNANEKGVQIIVYSNYTTKTVVVQ